MKERPILFSGPMVRAILDGRKSQTRRVVKPQPFHVNSLGLPFWRGGPVDYRLCPHGCAGDRLWVRETWAAPHLWNGFKPSYIPQGERIHYAADGPLGGLMKRPSIFLPSWASRITLEIVALRVERLQDISADDARAEGVKDNLIALSGKTKTSPFLPRQHYDLPNGDAPSPDEIARANYAALWQSINGHGSWDANPWVWVIEFKRIKP